MPRAKKTGRCTSWEASRICWDGERRVFALVAEVADDVLDHDDGAVDDHAEVQCAEGEEVCGNVEKVEADCREEESERNGEGDDDGAASVAEEEKENDDNEDDALGEVCGGRCGWCSGGARCDRGRG